MKNENEIKEKYLKEIYLNVLKAIIIVLYFFILNMSYENVARDNLLMGIKVFTMIFLFISIYIFEKAYKKDDGNIAIQGIEILALAIYTLTTEHITNKYNFNFKSYSLVASYLFAIYFVLKSIVAYTKGRNEVIKQLSDIREIVQNKEPTKKEATKKSKQEKVQGDKENIENKNQKTTKISKTKKKSEKNSNQIKNENSKNSKENPKKKKMKKEVTKND